VLSRALARLLGAAEPSATGVLIVGADTVARAFAEAFHDNGVRVLVADSYWANLKPLRMRGIDTFFGSAVSSFADDKLDLSGIGNLLAASRQPGVNELACIRYANEFGSERVFTITSESDSSERHRIGRQGGGRRLYGGEHTLDDIRNILNDGGEFVSTQLTDEFDYAQFVRSNPEKLVAFAIDDSGEVVFPVGDESFAPESGWTVVVLA
jgi:Trk K+ transport system NAD-binding subunit